MSFPFAIEAADRLTMQFSSWLMLLFAIVVLGGGLVLCIRRAIVVDREKRAAGDD